MKTFYKQGYLGLFPWKEKSFKFVCIVQYIFKDGEIEVMALTSCNSVPFIFKITLSFV